MPDPTARPSRSRRPRGRAPRSAPAATPAVEIPLNDLAAATALANEAASPFGYLRPAHELLAQFGGEEGAARTGAHARAEADAVAGAAARADAVARANAALAAVGIAADPPLATAPPASLVRLRAADVSALPEIAAQAAPAAKPHEAQPDEPDAAGPEPKRVSWAQRTAARHTPTGPVTRARQLGTAALGLAALIVLIVAVVVLRAIAG